MLLLSLKNNEDLLVDLVPVNEYDLFINSLAVDLSPEFSEEEGVRAAVFLITPWHGLEVHCHAGVSFYVAHLEEASGGVAVHIEEA